MERNLHAIDLFGAMGGAVACRALSVEFYGRVARDPLLRPFFPGKSRKCAIEEFTAFLIQFLGGPAEDTQRRWWLSLHESHQRFRLGLAERDAWLRVMSQAIAVVRIGDEMRSALMDLFVTGAAYVTNTGLQTPVQPQLQERWAQQLALDEAVAAIREGSADRARALALAEPLRACFERHRSVFAHFVGITTSAGMTAFALEALAGNPDLADERYAGRTLLHAAAAAGNVAFVGALLAAGVDANVKDDGGHTPLYAAANQCAYGADVVRVLVGAGARVDACDGVKRCTALHMAARRDFTEVAKALLDCGADIEARDSAGETPLRRAVNCGQTGVAALLIARGADPRSVGSKGLTPVTAARSEAIRRVLASK